MARLRLAAAALVAAALLVGSPAAAQTFVWDWSQGSGGAADTFTVKCRPTSSGAYTLTKSVNYPTQTSALSSVISTAGTYWCIVIATNGTGDSPPSNEMIFKIGVQGGGP